MFNDIIEWNNQFCSHVRTNFNDPQKLLFYMIGCLGCLKSHLEVCKLALERKYKNILILEDDTLVYEYATHDRVMIFHADMYLCPEADEEIDKLLKPGIVVSLTRIEPPLHPPGPEKILCDYGIEPEEFQEEELLNWIKGSQKK